MQLAFAFTVTLYKIALVVTTIFPCVSSETIWLAFLIATLVVITVLEILLAFAVFETIEKLTFLDIIFVFSDTISFLSTVCPLALVTVSVKNTPDPITMFSTCFPFSFVDFSIIPLESAFSFSQIIRITASVDPIIG